MTFIYLKKKKKLQLVLLIASKKIILLHLLELLQFIFSSSSSSSSFIKYLAGRFFVKLKIETKILNLKLFLVIFYQFPEIILLFCLVVLIA